MGARKRKNAVRAGGEEVFDCGLWSLLLKASLLVSLGKAHRFALCKT